MAETLKDADLDPIAEIAPPMKDDPEVLRPQPCNLSSGDFGQPQRPEGGGYMCLWEATYWIATAGGTLTIDLADKGALERTYHQLRDRIASEEVMIIGRRHGLGTPTKVEGHRFSGICFDHPFVAMPHAMEVREEPHVRCSLIDSAKWSSGFNYQLVAGRGSPEFTHLEVRKSDVAGIWPFKSTCVTGAPAAGTSTGTAGRPTSKHLFIGEMERRWRAGELDATLSREAAHLRQWLAENHPISPVPTAKAIENAVRGLFRKLSAAVAPVGGSDKSGRP